MSNSSRANASFSWKDREQSLQQLQNTSQFYDLCVVGGGITGAAIARDASLRGLKVLLVEKEDFAQGTSSRSSKLVHGGVRYLEQYEFGLVMESTRERARLWKLAPELVTPLAFLFPTFQSSRVPLWKLNIGLWLYDLLSRFRSPSIHKKLGKKATLEVEPGLRSDDLVGSIFYWDGATDDALLTLSNILDAREAGALPLSKVKLDRIEWNDKVSSHDKEGHTLWLKDQLNPESTPLSVRARVVVSAAGPWTDQLLTTLNQSPGHKLLAPTRGSHVVVPASRLPAKHAIVAFHPKDGRVLFVIPWGECSIIGTTDVFDDGSPDHVHVTSDEINYLIDAANAYFPAAKVKRDDIISTWSGLRPLLAPPKDASASAVSREHFIHWHPPGLLVIAGGKLTTHREMAQEAVEQIFKNTREWSAEWGNRKIPTPTLDRPLATFEFPKKAGKAIGQSEGARLSMDDIRGLCRTQMVLSIEDLLIRRTQIYYKEPLNGWKLLPALKPVLCEELNWDDEKWNSEVKRYRSYLEDTLLNPLGKDADKVLGS